MTMFDDLTKVNVPFGLLDRDTQEALKAHGGPWEYFGCAGEWFDVMDNDPLWTSELAYRVKPAPPKPRGWWLIIYRGHLARYDTNRPITIAPGEEAIYVREVLPE